MNGGLVLHLAVVAAVGVERLLELVIARRNLHAVAARGGLVADRRSYWDMTAFQVVWLVACAAEPLLLQRPFIVPLAGSMLAVAVACQALRYWAVITLGDRWNLRIVVVPGEPLVSAGPYRWLRHPNYLAVMIETLAVPLLHTAWLTAGAGLAAVLPLLRRRIRIEETALSRWGGPRG